MQLIKEKFYILIKRNILKEMMIEGEEKQ